MAGKVYLVGAGPGDARLITIKGKECIEKADAIVYDRLASPRLLKWAKPGVEKVYVGKLPDRHTMKQEEINQLLVDLALEGKVVVRLKGGDPTIFGRVGEEAELLRQNGISYEIVPGITSAISVPAYAGIPVTHREHASSLSIVTGHESPEKLDRMIQWDKVTHATGTLIFMMGVAKIGYISRQLIKHGRPPATPVALVRWGTRAEQDTLTGTLADIEEKVMAADFQPPAVIVVGDVVLQRERLKWAEKLPLFGKRILVTRTRSQASSLVSKIEDLGGEPYEFPVIETVAPTSEEAVAGLRSALDKLSTFDWVFFTSTNGVEFFFRHLKEHGRDIRSLAGARIVAVGPATAEALRQYGIVPEVLKERFQAEGLIDAYGPELAAGQNVLLPRGNLGRSWLPEKLTEMGLSVTEATLYENVLCGEDDEELMKLLAEGGIHAVTFTSSSTVTNLLKVLERMGADNPAELLKGSAIACIGPLTAQTAAEAGLDVTIMAEEATIDSLVEALCSWNQQEDDPRRR
ncbi:uroporphyrinogen-III C-methyltransferase [Paenibacillus ihbetae]|uniref:Uroporphyrinogen-III C-methyltransferase n=1 Tax=Paenibacillus ihbetae TaxID=1870820 RepID=A0A1B2DXE0_9BACL|nr:uroporphyrinogen-III C-methyltransferase [Paenibacillus ihbetae]ANY72404.1 uroporphyrinogen-III C-methyltransferase [Paenibacillus ihbetae]OOC58314.1 uroporphyrinogen-III C-methyltransferase [Paenibacillus ihbetae]